MFSNYVCWICLKNIFKSEQMAHPPNTLSCLFQIVFWRILVLHDFSRCSRKRSKYISLGNTESNKVKNWFIYCRTSQTDVHCEFAWKLWHVCFTNLFYKLILPWNRRNTYYSPNKPILMVDRSLRRESKVWKKNNYFPKNHFHTHSLLWQVSFIENIFLGFCKFLDIDPKFYFLEITLQILGAHLK